MKMQISNMKNGWSWSVHGVLLSGIVYSVLALVSEPAYAAACAPYCENYRAYAETICNHWPPGSGGVSSFECPVAGSSPEYFSFACGNGYQEDNYC